MNARRKLTACAVSSVLMLNVSTAQADSPLFGDIFNSDPCSNQARDIGTLAGAILGGILAKQLGGDNATKVIAAAAGALLAT